MSEKCYNNTTALCANDGGGQDTYGLLFDPDTNRLYWMQATVTIPWRRHSRPLGIRC